MRAAGANGNGRLPAEYVAEYVELVTPATRWSPTARRWAPSGTTVPCSVWCQDAKRRPVPTESLPPGRTLPPTSLTASAYAALERLTGTGAISDYRPTHVDLCAAIVVRDDEGVASLFINTHSRCEHDHLALQANRVLTNFYEDGPDEGWNHDDTNKLWFTWMITRTARDRLASQPA